MSAKCPLSKGTTSPSVAHGPLRTLSLLLGVCPSHQNFVRYEAEEFQTLPSPVYRVLIVFKPSPFSFSCSIPYGYFHSFPFSPAAFRGNAFLVLSPRLHPLSTSKNSSLPSEASLSPSPPLCAVNPLKSVVQVIQIVVLILRSIF